MPDDGTRYSYKTYVITQSQIDTGVDIPLSTGGMSGAPIQFLNEDLLELATQITVTRTRSDQEATLTNVTDYTVSTGQVDIKQSAVVVGDTIRIQRTLQQTENYVDWTNNSILDADQMDFAKNHTFYLMQEALDAAFDGLKLGPNGAWNGESIRSYNCGPATTNNGWVTLSQVNNLIAGVETAEISDVSQWSLAGNDSDTVINLTDFEGSIDESDVYVQIDGVMQVPDGVAYTVAGTNPPVVTLSSAPATGQTAYVRLISGNVAAIITSNTIQGSSIVDDTIDESKFGFIAGTAQRFIEIDATGQPTLTQLDHDDIQDFDTAVEAKRLDQFANPLGNLDMNGNKIDGLTAGGTGTDEACTVAQMETHVASEIASGLPSFQSYTGQNLSSSPITYTAPSGTWTGALVRVNNNSVVSSGAHMVSAGGAGAYTVQGGDYTTTMAANGNVTVTPIDNLGSSVTVNIIWFP